MLKIILFLSLTLKNAFLIKEANLILISNTYLMISIARILFLYNFTLNFNNLKQFFKSYLRYIHNKKYGFSGNNSYSFYKIFIFYIFLNLIFLNIKKITIYLKMSDIKFKNRFITVSFLVYFYFFSYILT